MQHELNCHSCIVVAPGHPDGPDEDCRRCYYSQVPAINDEFFLKAVRPYCWFAAVLLFLSYIIGLWFTLRTHAATIWNIEIEEKKAQVHPGANGSISHQPLHGSAPKPQTSSSSKDSTGARNASTAIRDTQLYKRFLSQSLKHEGLSLRSPEDSRQPSGSSNNPHGQLPHVVPPRSSDAENLVPEDNSSQRSIKVAGLSEEEHNNFVRHVAEMAATAAAVAARDAVKAPRKVSTTTRAVAQRTPKASAPPTAAFHDDHEAAATAEGPAGGGHDAPNWGRVKSAVILLGATVLYAIIAEILVNTVDVVLESVDIDEKFLGITLFALVPNTTEFLVCSSHVRKKANLVANHSCSECHLFRHEWQHRAFHGDWFSLCSPSLSPSDSRPRPFQRCPRPLHRSRKASGSHLQPHLPAMGHGDCHPLRFPA